MSAASSSSASLTAGTMSPAVRRFLVQALLWNLALFAVLRLAWVDQHLIGALLEFQKALVLWYGAMPNSGIVVGSSCSGADVMALCAGMTLAYPVAPGRRLAGAAFGIALILALNAVRIASLYAVAAAPRTLDLLHVYVWPVALTAATLIYVLLWMRSSDRRTAADDRQWRRFALMAGIGLLAYAAAAPWVLTSETMYRAGVLTAAAAGTVLAGLGVTAQATGNVLATARGSFQVTQECLFTPALPLYLAAVVAFPLRRRWLWLLAAIPVFCAAGVVRLLLLALPPALTAAPAVLAHGFYQLVAGAAAIVVAAHTVESRTSWPRASGRALAALGLAVVAAMAAAWLWVPALAWMARLAAAVIPPTLVPSTFASTAAAGDYQGALALLPGFQIGLLAGLWWALRRGRDWRLLVLALGVVALTQIAMLIVVGVVAARLDVGVHALVVRGWALTVPIGVTWLLFARGATRAGDSAYRRFWHDVGETFPTLTGAPSTTYYFENERRLLAEALPSLAGCTLLKTDLWDEAKNTRILQWAADQGARVYGIDLSEPIARQARAAFARRPLSPVVSDVRRLPFRDGAFDAVYSMGTIEHFAETAASVVELARILKPGGRLILGVPNRHDPFLRPLMVTVLHALGLYGYGYEKSYSRRQLRAMLEAAGLTVTLDSGVLFMPGWLRMLDLWCHTRARPLTAITRRLLAPFVWIDRHLPAARRHGYLIASVGVKPGAITTTGVEYVVDAHRCEPDALTSLPRLQGLFAEVLADLELNVVGPPLWHVFPGAGGVTGMVLLAESHLTIHTYPETGLAAINLYCCRASVEWPWDQRLRARLGADDVVVRVLRRG